jgi:cyclophilin family peptidyl-prolyl cis-trans isomerase
MAKDRKPEVDVAIKTIDYKKNKYQIQLDTSMGKMLLDLWPDIAPGHCNNLIGLTKIGFYNGIKPHRIIDGFVVQLGCPLGTGTGGPGYTIKAEFNDSPHEAGVISMARTSDPNSAGSQIFLCLGRIPHLDKQYTAFGKTANKESLDILLKMGKVETDRNDKPKKDIIINSAKVIETAI